MSIVEKRIALKEQCDEYLLKVRALGLKVTCRGCKRKVNFWGMFRCLYCGFCFCRDCANHHFERNDNSYNTLHLNLIREHFFNVYYKSKLEEYREIKPFYYPIFLQCYKDLKKGKSYQKCDKKHCSVCLTRTNKYNFRFYNTITFSNGFETDRDQFVIELKGIHIGLGFSEWGATKNKFYFVLKLGDILESNIK